MAEKRDILLRALLQVVYIFFIGFLIPLTVGFSTGGFENVFFIGQFSFYLVGAVAGIIILAGFFFMRVKSEDDEYGNTIFFSEQGISPALPLFKGWSTTRLLLASAIIFSILGLTAISTGQAAFTEFRVLQQQQFSSGGQLIFSSTLIPIAENLLNAALITVFIITLILIANRYDWKKASYKFTIILFVPLVTGMVGWANHLLRYGGSDISKLVVFVFWTIGGLITVLTGSFIPFWMMHLMNNLFFDARTLFSSDVVTTYAWVAIILMGILYGYLYIYRPLRKPREINNI